MSLNATGVVDHSALKVNQTGIVATVLVAFVGSLFLKPLVLLIPLLAVVLLLGTFAPQLALFKQIYFKVLRPRGIVKPRPVQDRPEPHNFAQGLGGVFLAVSSLFLWVGVGNSAAEIIGLALALLVAALAFVNLAFGYCLGCQIYYQLGRAGLIKATTGTTRTV
jgi:apolipoprotein N-acyltransferase